MFEQLPLKDIHLPDPVSWWPLAWGWWALPVLLVAGILGALWLRRVWRPRAQRRRLRRLARAELDRIERQYQEHGDPAELSRQLSIWLRRAAMTLHGRNVAGISGDDWADWLDRHGGGRFEGEVFDILRWAPYQRAAEGQQVTPLLTACHAWIETPAERAS